MLLDFWPFISKKTVSNSTIEYTALIELLDLSPMKKWIVFGRAPVKVLLHVALLIMSTASVLVYSGQWTSYMESTSRNWCNFFYPVACQASDCQPYNQEMSGGCYLYTSNDIYNAVQSAVVNYYNINVTSIAEYQYPRKGDSQEYYARLEVTSQVHASSMKDIESHTYSVTPTDLGPLNTANLTSFMYSVVGMQLIFELEDVFEVDYFEGCYKWSVRMYYTSQAKGNFRVTNQASILDTCHGTSLKKTRGDSTYFAVNLFTCLLSSIWLLLLIKDLGQSYNVMKLAQEVVDTGDIYPMLLKGIEEKIEVPKLDDRLLSQDQVNQIVSLLHPVEEGNQDLTMNNVIDDKQSQVTDVECPELIESQLKAEVSHKKRRRPRRKRSIDKDKSRTAHRDSINNNEMEQSAYGTIRRRRGKNHEDDGHRNTQSRSRRHTEDDIMLQHSIHYLFANSSSDDEEEEAVDGKQFSKKIGANVVEPIDLAAISQSSKLTDTDIKLELPSSWNKISTDVKLRFFNSWTICMIPAAAFSLAASCIRLNPASKAPLPNSLLSRLDAFAILLLWINLLSYMRFSSRLYSIVIILQGSIRSVGRVLLQALPLFIGYAVVGVVVYGAYVPEFGNIDYAVQTLFAVMNGDIIHNVIWDLEAIYPLVSVIYVVSFFFFFNYIILRCCLAVVSEMLVFIHVYSDIHKTRMKWRAQRSSGLNAQTGTESKQALLSDPAHSIDSFFSTGSETELPADDVMFFDLLDLVFTRYKNVYADYIEAGTGNVSTEMSIRQSVVSSRSHRADGLSKAGENLMPGNLSFSQSLFPIFSSYSISTDPTRGIRALSAPMSEDDEVNRQLRELAFASAISPSLGGKFTTPERVDQAFRVSRSYDPSDNYDDKASNSLISWMASIFDWDKKKR